MPTCSAQPFLRERTPCTSGFQNFNARRTAGNFTTEGLRQAVAFCHARDVRVYVTLNTTLYPGELTALAEAVAGIAAAGADAVITQDLAVGRACAPNGAGPGAARAPRR